MYKKLSISELNRSTGDEFRSMPKLPVVVVLDNIRSEHNVGSVFRSADAFAIDKIILCGICSTPPSAGIRKSALGAEETVCWEYCADSFDAVTLLKSQGYLIVPVEQTTNSTPLNSFTPLSNCKYAFIFGNEIKGVSQEIIDICHETLEIPQFGTKHSLNVSVSAGIVLWEVAKHLGNFLHHERL